MRRREFIGAIYGAALALPFAADAQQPGKVWRIGDVRATTPELGGIYAQALEQRLADLGYVQGRNIVLLHRFAGPQMDKMEEAIISLLPQVDLLVVTGNAAIAAKKLGASGRSPTKKLSIVKQRVRVHGRRLSWLLGWHRSVDRSVLGCVLRASGGVAERRRAGV